MRFASVLLLCAALAAPSFADDVPRPAPNLTIAFPGGKTVALNSLHGTIVVLAFIYTTCPHCQKLTGTMNAIARDYRLKGVNVVGVAFNDGVTESMVKDLISEFHPIYPVGSLDRASVLTFLQRSILTPTYVPHLVVIDRRGVIRGDHPGEGQFMTSPEANLRAELDKLLAAPASSAKTKK
jgi:peroxiredoxin